ncbi:efflux RND transporter periplasmic adaptor subunit [Brevibacterium sp. FAM 24638]|uniref:efflux RND transporter periplasmic adaptor subunit n=1 Tax=Brevibacterium sp. FAM 24638 TaxID=3415681 RepID=UPI003C7C17B9
MHVFRRVVLPLAFLLVLIIIAVCLGWIAFKPAADDEFDDVGASGEPADSTITAERGDISNALEVKGRISVDSPTAVKADHDGVVNHLFVQPGDEVFKGDQLFQVRSDDEQEASQGQDGGDAEGSTGSDSGEEASDDAAPAKPKYHTVIASEDGTAGDFSVKQGDTVSADTQVTELLKKTFTAKAPIKATDLYRVPKLPDTANIVIDEGPKPFDCSGLRLDQGPGTTSGSSSAGGEESEDPTGEGADDAGAAPDGSDGGGADSGTGDGPQLICAIPDDVTVYNSLDLTMTVDAGEAKDVIVVPVTAVRGLTDAGTVWVSGDDGEPEEREVKLGLNDGSMVEVKSGLDEGEEIDEFVPGTEPEDENADDEMDGEYVEGEDW